MRRGSVYTCPSKGHATHGGRQNKTAVIERRSIAKPRKAQNGAIKGQVRNAPRVHRSSRAPRERTLRVRVPAATAQAHFPSVAQPSELRRDDTASQVVTPRRIARGGGHREVENRGMSSELHGEANRSATFTKEMGAPRRPRVSE